MRFLINSLIANVKAKEFQDLLNKGPNHHLQKDFPQD